MGDSAVPEDKKKQIIVIIILVIIAALIFFFLYSPAGKELPFFAVKGTSVAAKGTASSSAQSGSAVIRSSDNTQDISILKDEYAQQEQLNFENGQAVSQQELSTAEQRFSQTGSIFSSSQSASRQGQSTLQQGQSTSQQRQTTSQQGQSTSQQRQTTSQQGQSTSQQGQSASRQGQSTLQQGQSALQQGQYTSQQGQSASQQGQSTLQQGQSALQQGQSTSQQGQSASQQGQSTSRQGQSALQQGQTTSQQGQSTSRQGQSALQQGQTTSQQGQSTSQQRQTTSQQGQSTSQQGQSASRQGQSAFQQGQSASQQGQSALQQGQSTSWQGQSTLQQGQSALQQGQSTSQQGQSASQQRQTISQQGQSTSQQGQSALQQGQSALQQGQSANAAGQTQQQALLSQREYQEARRTTPVRPAPVQRVVPANMRLLSSGTFEMETILDEQDTEENIIVQNVTVNSFYISKYEVTQKEYDSVMKKNPSYFKGPNLPVENVSWFDAIEYCNALSRREGLTLAYTITGTGNNRVVTWNRSVNGYRLPTEEEWVYACRANTTTPFNTGKSINRNMSNYFGRRTVNVGSYQPNTWGLYDMHGNVSEWCWNLFNTSSSSSETRIIRGGSWLNTSMRLRASFRDHYFPNMRTMSIGFRIAQNF